MLIFGVTFTIVAHRGRIIPLYLCWAVYRGLVEVALAAALRRGAGDLGFAGHLGFV